MSPHAEQLRMTRRGARAGTKYPCHSLALSGTSRVKPRCWTGWGTGRLLLSQDERASGGRHGPAQVHRDLWVLHLPAAARRVVIGVNAFGPAGAIVVDGPAELPHVLDHHRHPVGVALAQVAAGRVVGPLAPQLDDAARDVGAALALLAEA